MTSPAMQELFRSQIVPILVAAVPRVVIPVGAEDADELVRDALVAACEAVHRLEKRTKQIIPKEDFTLGDVLAYSASL